MLVASIFPCALQKLRPVHETLLSGFEKWVEGDKLPNSGEITRVFMEQKDGLLNYGVYAAKLPLATEKVEVALSSLSLSSLVIYLEMLNHSPSLFSLFHPLPLAPLPLTPLPPFLLPSSSLSPPPHPLLRPKIYRTGLIWSRCFRR